MFTKRQGKIFALEYYDLKILNIIIHKLEFPTLCSYYSVLLIVIILSRWYLNQWNIDFY